MPITKITLSTAMRARDVSRPHEEHLTAAAEREEALTRQPAAAPPRPAEPAAHAARPGPAVPPPVPAPVPAPPRRRRRRRS